MLLSGYVKAIKMKLSTIKKRKRCECATCRTLTPSLQHLKYPYIIHILFLLFPVCQRVSILPPNLVAASMNQVSSVGKNNHDRYVPSCCEHLGTNLKIRGGENDPKSRETSIKGDTDTDNYNALHNSLWKGAAIRNETSVNINHRYDYSRVPKRSASNARHRRLENDIAEMGRSEQHPIFSSKIDQRWQAKMSQERIKVGKTTSMSRARYPAGGVQVPTQRQRDSTLPSRSQKLGRQSNSFHEEYNISENSKSMNKKDNKERLIDHNPSTEWQHQTVPPPPPQSTMSINRRETHHAYRFLQENHKSDFSQAMNRKWETERPAEVHYRFNKWRRPTVTPFPTKDPLDVDNRDTKSQKNISTDTYRSVSPPCHKIQIYENKTGFFPPPPPPPPPVKLNPKFPPPGRSQRMSSSTITLSQDKIKHSRGRVFKFPNFSAPTASRHEIDAERNFSSIQESDDKLQVQRNETDLLVEKPVIECSEEPEIESKDGISKGIHSSEENGDGEIKETTNILDELSSNVQTRPHRINTASRLSWWPTTPNKKIRHSTQKVGSRDFDPGHPKFSLPLKRHSDVTTTTSPSLVKDGMTLKVTRIESDIKSDLDDEYNQINAQTIPLQNSCIYVALLILDTFVDEGTNVHLRDYEINFFPGVFVKHSLRKMIQSRGDMNHSQSKLFQSEIKSEPIDGLSVHGQLETDIQSISKPTKKTRRPFALELSLKDIIYYILWATVLVMKILWNGLNFFFMIISKIVLDRLKEKYFRKRKKKADLTAVRLSLCLEDEQSMENALSDISGVVNCLASVTQRNVEESTCDITGDIPLRNIVTLQQSHKVVMAHPVVYDIHASTDVVSKVFKTLRPLTRYVEKKRTLTRIVKPRKTILSLKKAEIGEIDFNDSEFDQLLSELSRDPVIEIEENTDDDDVDPNEIFQDQAPLVQGDFLEFEEELYDEFEEEYYTYDVEPYE